MIRFRCEHCGHKLSVPDEHKGKRGKCPKCKNTLIVPEEKAAISAPQINHLVDLKNGFLSDSTLTLKDVPEEYKLSDEPVAQANDLERAIEKEHESVKTEDIESLDECKLPWIIDTFLYPISASGMVHLAIFVIVPLLFGLFIRSIEYILRPSLGMATAEITESVTIIFCVIFYSYVCYYVADCVINSAKGQRRASESMMPSTISIGDFISQAFIIIGCAAVCVSPVLLYSVLIKRNDLWFWIMSAYGIFFLPMSLLRGIMFDTFDALNPIEIIRSIGRAFLPYCGLVLFFVVVGGLVRVALPKVPIWNFPKKIVEYYLIFVLAHRLGWFYWWYKDKIDWGL